MPPFLCGCVYAQNIVTGKVTAADTVLSGLFPNPNWYRVVQEVKNNTRTATVLSNAYLNIELIRDLNFKTSINIDYTNQRFNNFTPSTAGSLFSAPPIQTGASESKSSNYSWLAENTFTYKRKFGEHNFDVLAGYSAQRYYGESSNVNASGFPNDRIQTLNAGSVFTTGFGVSEWNLASFVSRLNYNYKNKYLLTASFRRDGSSRFAPNKKYVNFPSISAGWNATNEDFMTALPAVEMQYLEGTFGVASNFAYQFAPNVADTKPITGITGNNQNFGGWNIPSNNLIAAYEPGDLRKAASIADGYTDAAGTFIAPPFVKKYLHTHAVFNNTNNNWPVYRYADV